MDVEAGLYGKLKVELGWDEQIRNYTDGVSKTGIFFRSFNPSGMPATTQVIASSNTVIPGQAAGIDRRAGAAAGLE